MTPRIERSDCCSEKKESSCSGTAFIVLLLLVSIGTSIGSGYYFSQVVPGKVQENYLALEYKKSGDKETYELLAEAQRLQLQEQLPQIKQFVESKKGAPTPSEGSDIKAGDTTTPADAKKLTAEEMTAIKTTAFIEGNKDALITLVEYSDLECPYCIRQYKDGIIKSVHEKYGDKVNSIFKNFRGVPHENAEIEANASLCAGDLGGVEKYSAYYGAIFDRSNGGNGTGFSKDNLVPLAKELGLDTVKFQACIDSKKNIARFDAETEEGRRLGVQGTPGTVVINNKTGEYLLIAGAFPLTKFEEVIDKLLESK
ncbi:MAG: DsbA family protein [Candidatus Gracilibacteria bacterium]|nr:DsbA family protein [Candidatus Gracilibacteria bacterium]